MLLLLFAIRIVVRFFETAQFIEGRSLFRRKIVAVLAACVAAFVPPLRPPQKLSFSFFGLDARRTSMPRFLFPAFTLALPIPFVGAEFLPHSFSLARIVPAALEIQN